MPPTGAEAKARKTARAGGAIATLRIPPLDGRGPIWRQIRRALSAPILSGDWPPGTRIPTETALTGRFGVSRMTVLKAIQTLASDGLVRRRRRIGTVVASRARERPVFEIWDIPELVRRSGATYGYRLLECRALADDSERRGLLGIAPSTPTLWMRCLHLADGKPFQLEERLINMEAAPGVAAHPFDAESPGSWLLAHVPWTDAEHKIFAREAPAELARLLKVRPRAACLLVDRRTWNGRTPVTMARMWHPGSRHCLVGHFRPGG